MKLWERLGGRTGGDAPEPATRARLWRKAENAEIAKCWHNPEHLVPPEAWGQLGSELRADAQQRDATTTIRMLPVEDKILAERVFGGENQRFTVRVVLEKSRSGATVKHAMVRIPNDHWHPGLEPTFRRIALAIEPEEPAFRVGFGHKEGAYWHMIWPTDWDTAGPVFSELLPESLPNSLTSPASMLKSGDRIVVGTSDGLTARLGAAGLLEWKTSFLRNLESAIWALVYLDRQDSRDLFLLRSPSVLPHFTALVGELIIALTLPLLDHRLGVCPRCGDVTCESRSDREPIGLGVAPDADVFEAILQRLRSITVKSGRQFTNAGIWPMSRNSYFGRFGYQCSTCKHEVKYSAFLPLVPSPSALPQESGFCVSLSEFAKRALTGADDEFLRQIAAALGPERPAQP